MCEKYEKCVDFCLAMCKDGDKEVEKICREACFHRCRIIWVEEC